MIPRTVKMAQAVAAQLTPTQLENYGNVILNGYPYQNLSVGTAGAVGSVDAVSIPTAGTNYTDGTYTGVYLGSGSGGSFGYATVTVAGGIVTAVAITSGGSMFTVGDRIALGNVPRTAPGIAAQIQVTSVDQIGVTPAMKGWSTNYQQYYTGLQPNGYGVNPGDPAGFQYSVHSFSAPQGPIQTLGGNGKWLTPGTGYTPGTYPGAVLTGGSGIGATATIVVTADPLITGFVSSVTLVNPGTGYTAGDVLGAILPGGTGFFVPIGAITPDPTTGGEPLWAQMPRRANIPNNSWLYPVEDNPVPPPLDAI